MVRGASSGAVSEVFSGLATWWDICHATHIIVNATYDARFKLLKA